MKFSLAVTIAVSTIACATPVSPTDRAVVVVDTLEFVLGSADTWPRIGSMGQHQVVDAAAQEVCWVKYANPRMFECWRWDDQWIYHRVDHGLDGGSAESYEFTDGRWLPRQLAAGWSLNVPDNRIRWFDPHCQVVESKSGLFPYLMTAWLEPARDLGTDLGVREVLVLEYRPEAGKPANHWERFYFARGAGWFAWENPLSLVRFDRFGGPGRSRAPACGE